MVTEAERDYFNAIEVLESELNDFRDAGVDAKRLMGAIEQLIDAMIRKAIDAI